MDAQEIVHLFDGLAGVAALFLGYQVKQAVTAIRHVTQNHEGRLARLERRRGARR